MDCPNVKFPVLPLTSIPRVSGENLTNAGSIFAPLGKSKTFAKPSYPILCNCILGPIEEKVLPSPIEFPAQGITEPGFEPIPTASPDEPLNWSRLILMAKGQPQ